MEDREKPEVLLLLLSWRINVDVVDVDVTLADDVEPILQFLRRKKELKPRDVNPELGEDGPEVGSVPPLDSEKYEGLSVNIWRS